jgi:DNA-directed RNA polymerase alpha subunit
MEPPQDFDDIFIKQLNLSQRTANALNRKGIFTVSKLKKLLQSKELEKIPFIGQKSLDEISIALSSLNKNTCKDIKDEKKPDTLIGSFIEIA